MRVRSGALVREQNENDVDDSCFDTAECFHMLKLLESKKTVSLNLEQFIIDGKLQRHPQTKFPNDISSDQAHMFALASLPGLNHTWLNMVDEFPRTSNGRVLSWGLYAELHNKTWLKNLALFVQMIFFWWPVRWNDGKGSAKIQFGWRHHCGDYRLFKQCLYYSWVKHLVRAKTLKKMTRYYWEPEPNKDWLISIDDQYIDLLKGRK